MSEQNLPSTAVALHPAPLVVNPTGFLVEAVASIQPHPEYNDHSIAELQASFKSSFQGAELGVDEGDDDDVEMPVEPEDSDDGMDSPVENLSSASLLLL